MGGSNVRRKHVQVNDMSLILLHSVTDHGDNPTIEDYTDACNNRTVFNYMRFWYWDFEIWTLSLSCA